MTDQLRKAIQEAGRCLRNEAFLLKGTEEYKRKDSVGDKLRKSVEESFQQVDLIEGWLKRTSEKDE